MRRLREGEPAAHGGRSPTRPWPRPPALQQRRSWHPPGYQLRAGSSSIRGLRHALAGQPRPGSLAAAASLRGTAFLFASGPPCLRRPAAFNPRKKTLDSGPLMLGDSASSATGSCQDCASSRKTGEQGSR